MKRKIDKYIFPNNWQEFSIWRLLRLNIQRNKEKQTLSGDQKGCCYKGKQGTLTNNVSNKRSPVILEQMKR